MGEKKGIVFALCLVFALLLINGVYAYVFEMSEIPAVVQKGEIVSLGFSASPGEGESLAELDKFGYFTFYLSGPAYFGTYCSFLPNGTMRYECEGVEIMKTQDNVSYSYAINIDTSQYVAGEYYLDIVSRVGYQYYLVGEGEFNITAENLPMKACSVRASGGESDGFFLLDEQPAATGNNKLNFNMVVRNGKTIGEGYLTSQYGRQRSSYKFKIARVLENNNDNAVIAIGYGWGSYVYEDALIFLDKRNNIASMKGMWPEVSNMKVSLMKGC